MKQCLECGKDYAKRPRRSKKDYARQKYCSLSCSVKATGRQLPSETKVCVICETEFRRKKGVKLSKWKKKQTCSRSCATKLQQQRLTELGTRHSPKSRSQDEIEPFWNIVLAHIWSRQTL